jgi:hypothetical protein
MKTQREYDDDLRADAMTKALGLVLLIAWILLGGLGKEVL